MSPPLCEERLPLAVLRLQVFLEPRDRKASDLFERAGFFEEMRCACNYSQFFLATKLSVGLLIQLDYWLITPADDQQGRRFDTRERNAREVGSPAARYDSANLFSKLRSSNQGGPGTGASPKKPIRIPAASAICDTNLAASTSRLASKLMSNLRWRVIASTRSSCRVNISISNVPVPDCRIVLATYWLRGL